MVTVSSPTMHLSTPTPPVMDLRESEILLMDNLLDQLKKSTVELVLQGDEVTRQMWQMHTVFEELFARHSMTSDPPPKRYAPLQAKVPDSALPEAVTMAAGGLNLQQQVKAPSPRAGCPTSPSKNKVVPTFTGSSDNFEPTTSECTSNPLLDTIGVLAGSNPDSDDSDLDAVYQQLRSRGRQRRPDQVRVRRHQPVASSDPESIGYAGSNSIDSGYKSLCATPEVSDSLSAPEVRRSASDVSASDSSTASGPQDGPRIKMGTRSAARTHPISDVALDHLMYLRQSLRKDRPEGASPSDSLSSASPRAEWAEESGEGSIDHLLSGAEYYDLESIQEFPAAGHYVAMLEERARSSKFQVSPVPALKPGDAFSKKHLSSLYRKRTEPILPVESEVPPRLPLYGAAPAHPARAAWGTAARLAVRHHRPHRATDSKLTEAAIRVLEMIEDFRLEEAIGRRTTPRQRRSSGRPASTGSLLEAGLDVRSIASADHHVYEEIMYDLVCEGQPATRTRLLPAPPPLQPRRAPRSHKHLSGDFYAPMRPLSDRYLELEWQLSQKRRENLPPDFPI